MEQFHFRPGWSLRLTLSQIALSHSFQQYKDKAKPGQFQIKNVKILLRLTFINSPEFKIKNVKI